MRDRSQIWCAAADLSVDEIDRRANEFIQGGQFPETVFLSFDLYSELLKQFHSRMRGTVVGHGATIAKMVLTAGTLDIKPVKALRNFCLVGTNTDYEAFIAEGVDPIFWSNQERARIDREFEKAVLESR